MFLMYDTGARLAEIRAMKLCGIIWARKVEGKLFGKGSKKRPVPITDTVTAVLRAYLKEFHPNADDDYLF